MLALLKTVAIISIIGFTVWRLFAHVEFGGYNKPTHLKPGFGRTAIFGAFLLIGAIVVFTSFGTIGAGERGVVLRFGAATGRVVEPGFYVVTPLIERVHAMDVRVQKGEVEAAAVSKDLQQVTTKVALNFYPSPASVARLYATVGDDYGVKIVDPAIQADVKTITAQYPAQDLVARRAEVTVGLGKMLRERLRTHFIVVDTVNITNFQFSPEYAKIVEEKVVAQQAALKAQNDLERVKFEAQQNIEQARGEAEKIRIQAEAITKQGGREYVQLQAIAKWNGGLPTYLGGNAPIPFINIQGGER